MVRAKHNCFARPNPLCFVMNKIYLNQRGPMQVALSLCCLMTPGLSKDPRCHVTIARFI